jgi:hypothetical protein
MEGVPYLAWLAATIARRAATRRSLIEIYDESFVSGLDGLLVEEALRPREIAKQVKALRTWPPHVLASPTQSHVETALNLLDVAIQAAREEAREIPAGGTREWTIGLYLALTMLTQSGLQVAQVLFPGAEVNAIFAQLRTESGEPVC